MKIYNRQSNKIGLLIRRAGLTILMSGSMVLTQAQTHTIFPEQNDILTDIHIPWDTARIARAVTYAAGTNLGKKQPDSAFNFMHETLAASKSLSFPYGIASSLYQLGNAYTAKSLYTEAESTYREAIPYCMNDGRTQKLLPVICNNLGRLYHIRGDLSKAAMAYYQGILLAENYFPDVDMDYAYSNLAAILIQMGRPPDQSRYYLNKAETGARKKNNYYVLSNVIINTGITYNNVKQWDSSIRYFEKALAIGRAHKLPEVIYLAYTNLGIALLEKNMPGQALICLEKADSISRDDQIDLSYMNSTAATLGAAYMQLKRYKEAEKVLLQTRSRAMVLQQPLIIRETHWSLARLYAATGNYEKAYKLTQAYISLNDSISGREIINNVNQIEVKFRTAEKDKELIRKQLLITSQERDLQRKNFWITTAVSAALIILLLSVGLYSRHRTRRRLLDEQLSNLKQQQEIGRLKAMMEGEENERNRIARELHDGIGGLIAAAQLNAAVLKQDHNDVTESDAYNKLREILDDIGNEIRKTAHNMMPEILLHHNLPEAIRHFCRHIGQNRELHIDVQAYGSFELLTDEYRLSVYRIVQELIHNVVKHADATQVLMQIIMHPPVLSITVEDNGQGFNTDQRGNGAGLMNLQNRIQNMNGTLSMKSKPGQGTSVYIEISLPGEEHSSKKAILQRQTY